MPDKDWFEGWFSSPYYHLLYSNRNDEEAALFIKALIDHLKPTEKSKMLDVGCGQGRHAKILGDLGFDVTGIDISFKSIAEASKYNDENLHFYRHDMRSSFWINYFDFAFNFFTSFGYFKTRREHDNAIRSIAQSIKLHGSFVIDYLNVHYVEDNLQRKQVQQIDDIKFHLSKWHDEDHFFKQIQVEEKGSSVKHLFTEKVAKFSLGDFNDMFAYQGLQIQEVFGDYDFGSYDVKKSPRMIIVAKKIRH